MADATLGSTTIPLPLNYVHEPAKLESRQRTLDGSMIVNYTVTTGDVAVTKYHFEIPGITKSERLDIREEALKTGNITYIDNITIPEVFSHDGTTGSINLQRGLGTTSSSDITVELDSSGQTVTVSTGTNPSSGNVYITTDGVMTFGTNNSGTNNLIVNYIPSYTVHVLSDSHTIMQKSSTGAHISRYNLIMEEI